MNFIKKSTEFEGVYTDSNLLIQGLNRIATQVLDHTTSMQITNTQILNFQLS